MDWFEMWMNFKDHELLTIVIMYEISIADILQ